MNYPTCKVELEMADRHGVEIDYCPQCRVVWLDQPQLPDWKQRAVDRMLGAAKALAADTNDAILAKNDAGPAPPMMNAECPPESTPSGRSSAPLVADVRISGGGRPVANAGGPVSTDSPLCRRFASS
jgi:hypothetical protein